MLLRAASIPLLLGPLLGSLPGARPHAGPPVNIEVEIAEGRIGILLQAEQATINPWLGILPDRILGLPLPEEKREPLLLGATEFLARSNPWTLDGVSVTPEVRELRLAESFAGLDDPPIFELELEIPVEGWPKSIGITWETWENTAGLDGPRIPILFRWPVGEFVFGSLNPDEPAYTWHALPGLGEKRAVATVGGEPVEPELPLASVLIAAVLLFSIPVLRKVRPPLPVVIVLWGVGLSAAWYLRENRVQAPWSRVELPAEDEAIAMFETLHGNIYQAFASRAEDDVYELLSKSVAPEILDELYGEVYESMILRGEGGAVCDVQKLEVLERGVVLPEEEAEEGERPSFEINWRWQVQGLVSHFNHKHERTNLYHARYVVAHDGASWKIADVEILDHKRLESYGGF